MIRVMPNTGSVVQSGASVYSLGRAAHVSTNASTWSNKSLKSTSTGPKSTSTYLLGKSTGPVPSLIEREYHC